MEEKSYKPDQENRSAYLIRKRLLNQLSNEEIEELNQLLEQELLKQLLVDEIERRDRATYQKTSHKPEKATIGQRIWRGLRRIRVAVIVMLAAWLLMVSFTSSSDIVSRQIRLRDSFQYCRSEDAVMDWKQGDFTKSKTELEQDSTLKARSKSAKRSICPSLVIDNLTAKQLIDTVGKIYRLPVIYSGKRLNRQSVQPAGSINLCSSIKTIVTVLNKLQIIVRYDGEKLIGGE